MNDLDILVAKDKIKELVALYSRAVDRHDHELMRSLYAKDGYDDHGSIFKGTADEFYKHQFREKDFSMTLSCHFVGNHLIDVESPDSAQGEVYLSAFHHFTDNQGAVTENIMLVRYLDRYTLENEKWRFAFRKVVFDHELSRPIPPVELPQGEDVSFQFLTSRLFAKGSRD